MATAAPRIDSFNLPPGRTLAGKYMVEAKLGEGWEGEVYKVVETRTGIPRAAKLFYPVRNVRDRAVRVYAKKLEQLRHCPIVIQYHHSESLRIRRAEITCLISDYVEGELLQAFVKRQPGGRLRPFEALHLTYALAYGLEEIHRLKQYHGDLHAGNVLGQPSRDLLRRQARRLLPPRQPHRRLHPRRRRRRRAPPLRRRGRPRALRLAAPRDQGDLPRAAS